MPYKIKILHAYKSFYPDLFGGIPYVIEMLSRLAPDKFEQCILVTSRVARRPQTRNGVRIICSYSWGDLLSLPMAPFYPIQLWIQARAADVIVMHAPFPLADLVLGLFLSRRKRLIVYWHSHIISQKRAYKLIKPIIARTLNRADCIIISHPSLSYKGSILEKFSSKSIIIPYAIDTDTFNPSKKVVDISRDRPRVVACGRLVKYKGFDVLIEAARSIDAEIIIVGDGVERIALMEQVRSAGLSERVKLIGSLSQEDLIAMLRSADVFAFPSVSVAETFGIAQLEAMACGCPIVNTRISTAVPEIARDSFEAITIEPNDPGALAEAINLLLKDVSMRMRLAENARQRAVSVYDHVNYKLRISDVFMHIAEGKKL